jgi:SagB-type dehydrogenase family enzyme
MTYNNQTCNSPAVSGDSSVTTHNTGPAKNYHEATKLTYINLHNKPPLYKSYVDVPVIPLPQDFPGPEVSTLDAVAGLVTESSNTITAETLASLLYYSAGLIRKRFLTDVGEVHYRAAASAGALYPIETYLICQDMSGLQAGVYHFSPRDFTLNQLRIGDYRDILAEAAADEESIADSAVTFIFTSIFWRSTWKYRARGYRYCLWDNGTMIANLTSTASALGLFTNLVLGFVDQEVDQLLGVDGEHEASICLVSVGKGERPASRPGPPDIAGVSARPSIPPEQGIMYPEVLQMHSASLLHNRGEVREWRHPLNTRSSPNWESLYLIESLSSGEPKPAALTQGILERGSTRRYSREPLAFPQLSELLDNVTKTLSADFLGVDGNSLIDLYMIVNSVDGLPSGAYFFSPQHRGLELLEEGDFREEAGHLCFEQALGADASVVVFLMSDLEKVLEHYGNRGYRAAQLEAGIIGGKLYLCAYSLDLGASGITFYDDEITDFFAPHAATKSAMFVVTLGKRGRPNRVRPFRSQVAVKLDALARGAGQD